MKNIIFLILLSTIFGIGSSHAQTSKGQLMVGMSSGVLGFGTNSLGGIRFTSAKFNDTDDDKSFSFDLNPRIGYFFIENLAVGLNINTLYQQEKSGEYKYSGTLLSAGPYLRYYFPLGKILPFAEINSQFGFYNQVSKNPYYDDNKTTSDIIQYGGGLGAAILFNDKVSLDLLLNYSRFSIDWRDSGSKFVYNNFGINLGLSIYLLGKGAE